jgi:hypothetical protein
VDIVVDFTPARSLDGISFSDITSVPYLGYEIAPTLTFPDQETVSVDVHVLHFDGDLTIAERTRIIMRCRTTPIEESIRTKAQAAMAANENYLAIAAPTAGQAVPQVRVLTRECQALLRLVLGLLDSDDV